MLNIDKNTIFVKETATKLGFQRCGIAKAQKLEEEELKLEAWLNGGRHGEMAYMANHFDKRLDPTKLVPGSKSVISLLYNYFPEQDISTNESYKIAEYAYGEDYHYVIKDKLKTFIALLREEIGELSGRVFVDSAPVMERQWAERAGLGWLGKNSLLLNREMGSFFFIAELIVDVEFAYDSPISNYCGTCTRCLDACPTEAIDPSGVVDGSRCISYLTIELKDMISESFKGQFEDWIFGCDICQDVCPWNRFAEPAEEPKFRPHQDLHGMSKNDWQEVTQEVFSKLFRKSAVNRTKYGGFKRNIAFVKKSRD